MRFDTLFIAVCVFAGAAIALLGQHWPQVKLIPGMILLLAVILVFDVASAYVRGVPVMLSVSTTIRAIGFVAGTLALTLSGGL